jgi:hypothetical protein
MMQALCASGKRQANLDSSLQTARRTGWTIPPTLAYSRAAMPEK